MNTETTNTTNTGRIGDTQQIAAEKLGRSPLNVRRTRMGDGIDELKASILAHGLIQNLVVTANGSGRYQVIAGGRRIEAIHALQKEGKLPEGYAVPCQVVDDAHAVELSLAENVVRVAMHPADEFDAYADLAEKGHSSAAIAERFGVTERHVLQRLKLARIAPELLTEYRAGNLDLEALMAFAVTDDRVRQMEVYRSLQDWQRERPDQIRRMLTKAMIDSEDKLALFVGREAYEAASGLVRSDLFGGEVYFEDLELLQRLVGEKLEEARRTVEAEGWGWIEVQPDDDHGFVYQCSRLQPDTNEAPPELLAEREAAEDALRALEEAEDTEEDRASAYFYDDSVKFAALRPWARPGIPSTMA